MTKPSEKDIQEAMEWVGLALEPFDDVCSYDHHGYCQSHFGHEKPCPYEPEEQEKHLKTLRTALEEYGKPKTVSGEWVGKATEFLCEMSESGELMDVHLVAILDEIGIEITGPSPDNISKEVNNGS